MATFTNNPGKGFVTTGAIGQYLLVNAAGALTGSNTNNDWIGVTLESRTAAGQVVPVRFRHAGTMLCTMSVTEAIAVGTIVYKAASGCITAVSTGSIAVGVAMSVGATAGDWVEVLPY